MVKKKSSVGTLEHRVLRFTEWMGSVPSVILHTVIFTASFSLWFFGVPLDSILLTLTTLVSLEAIYLSLFIQMTVNRNTQSLEEVEEDIEEIQKDVDEIQEDVEEIEKDVDEIEKDVDEIQKDIDEVQEDVEEMTEEETAEQLKDRHTKESLDKIESTLAKLIDEIEKIKAQK